ncbi:MAG: hypothetical protein J1E39_04980 [Eubacterium sp.]|nr:hypothetical protein [Eubacterium sp.]
MKYEPLSKAIEKIDDSYINEAADYHADPSARKRIPFVKYAAVAACGVLAVGAGAFVITDSLSVGSPISYSDTGSTASVFSDNSADIVTSVTTESSDTASGSTETEYKIYEYISSKEQYAGSEKIIPKYASIEKIKEEINSMYSKPPYYEPYELASEDYERLHLPSFWENVELISDSVTVLDTARTAALDEQTRDEIIKDFFGDEYDPKYVAQPGDDYYIRGMYNYVDSERKNRVSLDNDIARGIITDCKDVIYFDEFSELKMSLYLNAKPDTPEREKWGNHTIELWGETIAVGKTVVFAENYATDLIAKLGIENYIVDASSVQLYHLTNFDKETETLGGEDEIDYLVINFKAYCVDEDYNGVPLMSYSAAGYNNSSDDDTIAPSLVNPFSLTVIMYKPDKIGYINFDIPQITEPTVCAKYADMLTLNTAAQIADEYLASAFFSEKVSLEYMQNAETGQLMPYWIFRKGGHYNVPNSIKYKFICVNAVTGEVDSNLPENMINIQAWNGENAE